MKPAKNQSTQKLVELYEELDANKPASRKYKIDVSKIERTAMTCLWCKKNIFAGNDLHFIGRFGEDMHVHIMHWRCFCNLKKEQIRECPFCRNDRTETRSCAIYEELAKAQGENLLIFSRAVEALFGINGIEIFETEAGTHVVFELACS